jgi:hypothetical protein
MTARTPGPITITLENVGVHGKEARVIAPNWVRFATIDLVPLNDFQSLDAAYERVLAERDEAVALLRVLRADAQRLSELCASLDGDGTFDAICCYNETSSDTFTLLSRLDSKASS